MRSGEDVKPVLVTRRGGLQFTKHQMNQRVAILEAPGQAMEWISQLLLKVMSELF